MGKTLKGLNHDLCVCFLCLLFVAAEGMRCGSAMSVRVITTAAVGVEGLRLS